MKKILVLAVFITFLQANENILSKNIQENIKLQKEQINETSNVLQNSWIDPLMLSVSKGKNKINSKLSEEEYLNTSIKLKQDIFRSGGIFYAIKYAKSIKKLNLNKLKSQKNNQIIQAYMLLANIIKNDKLQEQQNLLIKNATLEIKRKKEQYLAGLIDISFLNNTIFKKVNDEKVLLSLKDTKESLLNEFKKLSDKDYENLLVPDMNIPSKEQYLKKNLILNIKKENASNKNIVKKLTSSKYLPKLSINASYDKIETKTDKTSFDDARYNYGISLSMPLNFSTFDDMEKSKLEYLISQNNYQTEKQNQEKEYDKIISDLKRINKKIDLEEKNISLYNELITQTKELVEAKMKIDDDQAIMENSRLIRTLQVQILKLEYKAKKLEFYRNFYKD